MKAMLNANIKSLRLLHSGKVRDMYEIDDKHILIVTTDRLSAFDVVLPTPIPGKGCVLNKVSDFWFDKLSNIVPSHVSDMTLEEALPDAQERESVAIVRGYLIGSGWKEYQKSGSVCGIDLPKGLNAHDENISFERKCVM